MKIRKGGIYKTIDVKDFGIFQAEGWEKVIVEAIEPKPVVEEVKAEESEKVIELPKSKKKKK